MALNQVQVGPQVGSDGLVLPQRGDKFGAGMVTELMPRYYELSYRGGVFLAANSAATTTSVALATTYTGLCLSNPAGSGKNLVPLQVGFALAAAPAAVASVHLIGGYSAAGVVTHTTPLTPISAFLTGAGSPVAKADAAATVVNPLYLMPLMGGFTAAALPSTSPALIDLGGSIIVPPGGWVAIGTLTATSMFGSFTWAEVAA